MAALPDWQTLEEYLAGRESIFPSVHSLRRFVRANKAELLGADALLYLSGRWLVQPRRCDRALEIIGVRQAHSAGCEDNQWRQPLQHDFERAIKRWLDEHPNEDNFTALRVLKEALNVADDRAARTRVGIALATLHCLRVERRMQRPRFVYQRPHRNTALSLPEGLAR